MASGTLVTPIEVLLPGAMTTGIRSQETDHRVNLLRFLADTTTDRSNGPSLPQAPGIDRSPAPSQARRPSRTSRPMHLMGLFEPVRGLESR